MGIVVTIVMLLGLLMSLPKSCKLFSGFRQKPIIIHRAIILLFIFGLWNSAWHGLRYLEFFWGIAALLSGILMILTATLLVCENQSHHSHYPLWLQSLSQRLTPIKWVILTGLLLSFLLYSITLIQLNLGYPIIH